MDKKLIGVLIIVIAVLLGIGAYAYMNMNTASFGKSTVTIPDGYKVTKTDNNSITFTNNKTTYYINDENNRTIDSIFNKYKKDHKNDTVVENSNNVNNVNVRSITLQKDGKTIHTNYYFNKDNTTYHVFVKGKNDPKIFNKIVESTGRNNKPI